MDRTERNDGPNAKDRINKAPTSAAESRDETEFDIAGNVRERGEDPSPADRERGERSSKERAGAESSERYPGCPSEARRGH